KRRALWSVSYDRERDREPSPLEASDARDEGAHVLDRDQPSDEQQTDWRCRCRGAPQGIGALLEPVDVHGVAAHDDPIRRCAVMCQLFLGCRPVREVRVKLCNDPTLVGVLPACLDETAPKVAS